MAFTILEPQPALRDEALAYDDLGPGLYPGETAIRLDGRTLVAASVDQQWLENGAGVSFKACARWIDAKGETRLSDDGKHVEAWATHTASPAEIDAHGVDAIALEMLLLVLGEPPRLTIEAPVLGGDLEMAPVLAVAEEIRLGASIRHAVKTVRSTPATADVGALLAAASSSDAEA